MDGAEHRGARTRVGVVALLAAVLLTGACGGVSRHGSGEDTVMSAAGVGKGSKVEFSIALSIKLLGPVRMTLRNLGEEPIIVNRRFLVNDRAAPPEFREVYFTIRTPGGGTAGFAWDLKAGFPEAKDFRKLKPGAAVSSKVDLNDLYLMEEEGIYYVRATYQNVHAGPTVFDDATGQFSVKDIEAVRIKRTSEKLKFRITG